MNEKMNIEYISRRLKQSRLRQGYSQFEVSDKAGISPRTYQRMENCEAIPRLDQVLKVADVLKMNIGDLCPTECEGYKEVFVHALADREHLQYIRTEFTQEEVDWIYDDTNFKIPSDYTSRDAIQYLMKRFESSPLSIGINNSEWFYGNKVFYENYPVENDQGTTKLNIFFQENEMLIRTYNKLISNNRSFWVLFNKVPLGERIAQNHALGRTIYTENGEPLMFTISKHD